jgi:hypothetical protein
MKKKKSLLLNDTARHQVAKAIIERLQDIEDLYPDEERINISALEPRDFYDELKPIDELEDKMTDLEEELESVQEELDKREANTFVIPAENLYEVQKNEILERLSHNLTLDQLQSLEIVAAGIKKNYNAYANVG